MGICGDAIHGYKMHRLRAYFRRGKVEFDGIEDTLLDIAAYAAIALVLHRETDRP